MQLVRALMPQSQQDSATVPGYINVALRDPHSGVAIVYGAMRPSVLRDFAARARVGMASYNDPQTFSIHDTPAGTLPIIGHHPD